MKAYYYIDSRGREVLHVPFVFIVTNKKEPEIILEPRKLKCRQINWKNGRISIEKIIGYPEIDKRDIDAITELCFGGRIAEARDYCIDTFDRVVNKLYNIYQNPDK